MINDRSISSDPESWMSRQSLVPPGFAAKSQGSSSSVKAAGSAREPMLVKITTTSSAGADHAVHPTRSQGCRPTDAIDVASKGSSRASSNHSSALAKSTSNEKKPKGAAPVVVKKKKGPESLAGSVSGSAATSVTSVKFAKEMPRLDLVLGDSYTVQISDGYRFPVVWFQRTEYLSRLERMQMELQCVYLNLFFRLHCSFLTSPLVFRNCYAIVRPEDFVHTVKPGTLVVAKYKEDNQWYRARVIQYGKTIPCRGVHVFNCKCTRCHTSFLQH